MVAIGQVAQRAGPDPPFAMLRPPRHTDRGAISGAVAGASFIGGIAGAMARSQHPYPRPGSTGAEIRRYFRQDSKAPYVSVAGQLVSAAAMARFTASVAGLAGRSPRGPRALRVAAGVGGGVASVTLATSAVYAARLAGGRDEDPDHAVAMARRAFLAGGPIHGAGLGVLLGALGLAGLRTEDLPRRLSLTALAAAPPNLLGMLYLLAEPAGWFIPAGRFPGLIVVAVAGARLSRRSG
jgi:hypothetical protein